MHLNTIDHGRDGRNGDVSSGYTQFLSFLGNVWLLFGPVFCTRTWVSKAQKFKTVQKLNCGVQQKQMETGELSWTEEEQVKKLDRS